MLYEFTEDEIARFCKKMREDEHGCWRWTASLSDWGYGQFAYRGRREYAHRIAWMIAKGDIPDGKRVLHNCDALYEKGDTAYRQCCNPDHLWLGTDEDNRLDMVAKGRQRKGAYRPDNRLDLTCQQCGAAFRCRPDRPQKFCSYACKVAAQTGVSQPRRATVGKVEKACPVCGVAFQYYACWPRTYCSRVCAGTMTVGNFTKAR